jgi:hypothetical protein
MNLRNLLIRAYPRRWRAEFGPELAAILALKGLTPSDIADVLAGAARQHIRQDPWKICALGLSLWTSGLAIAAFEGLFYRQAFLWCYSAGQLFLFAAGAWTAFREGSVLRGMAASVKAAIPVMACIVAYGLAMLHYQAIYGRSVYYLIWKSSVVTILISLIFGVAGAFAGRLFGRWGRPRA